MECRKIISSTVALALAVGPFGCTSSPEAVSERPGEVDPFETVALQAPKTTESASGVVENVKVVGNQIHGRLYFPTVDAATSPLLLEKIIPTEVQANKPFNYQIKVTNVAKLKLEGIEVMETVPGTFKIKDVTEGTPDGKPNSVTYLIGALNPGEQKIVSLQGTATQSGALGMCLSAKYSTSLCMATTVVAPALKLAAVGSGDVMKCDTLSYKLTVTNTGSGAAKNVTVESVLPDGLVTADGKAAVAFDAGNLNAGESREFAFTVKANKIGKYELKATAKADEGLASESQTITTTVREPVLQIVKTGPEKAFIGQPIAYEIVVTNKGDGPAKDTVVIDSMPKGTAIQAVSEGGRADNSGRIQWNLGEIAPGATKKVAVVITADQAGELKTAAVVQAQCAEAQTAITSTTLSGVPALGVAVSDGPDPVRVGDQTTYTIEVTNQGTAAGTGIKLVCTLEDPMDFVSAKGDTKETFDAKTKTVTFAPIGSLAPKQKATFKITVKANKTGDVRFKAAVTSDQLGRPVEQTEATVFFGN